MTLTDIIFTGAYFIIFYRWFGIEELVSFAALGTFVLAYWAWVLTAAVFIVLCEAIFGKVYNKKLQDKTNKYDEYILLDEEEDDDDIGINISFK